MTFMGMKEWFVVYSNGTDGVVCANDWHMAIRVAALLCKGTAKRPVKVGGKTI